MPIALHLPIELLYLISEYLDDPGDLSSWSRSCRAFHAALTPLLYHNVKDDPMVMCWACDEGQLDVVHRLLHAGANPNVAWAQNEPRWWTLEDLHNAHCARSLQSEEDSSLFWVSEELPSRHSHQKRDPLRIRFDASEWLTTHAAVDYEDLDVIEYFDQDYYCVEDDDVYGVAELGLEEGDGLEPGNWPEFYYSDSNESTKTFPQRCYWTPLHIAAAWGNDKLVNLLLDNGADVNSLSRLFCPCAIPPGRRAAPLWTPLHTSMCHGHESTTRLLLSRGASTNLTTRRRGSDESRFTALHSACTLDLLDAARALVDGGYQTDVTVRDHKNLTPLAHAFFRGNWAMIDFLLEHGANINDDIGALNALGHACLLGYYAEALRLLDLGATPQYDRGRFGEPRFYFHLIAVAGAPDFPSPRSSKQKEFRVELTNRLIKYGINVNQRGFERGDRFEYDGTRALLEAASFHRVDTVKALLHSGADVRASADSLFSFSALQRAIFPGSEVSYSKQSHVTPRGAMLNTVRALLEAMAKTPGPRLVDVELVEFGTNEFDTTDDVDIGCAIRMICSLPYKHPDELEVVALFLKYNRAVEIATEERNLVYDSLHATHFSIADLLLENGFNRPSEKQFMDLIHRFISSDGAEGLCHILNRFPDIAPRIRNDQLLFNAVDTGSRKCAELLINEGVPINSRNENGCSLLLLACLGPDTHTAELLLKNGADPDECTPAGDSLTTVAAFDGNGDMIRLLLDYGASIHSSPPGKPTRHPNMGFLDIAINSGLVEAVEEIVDHKTFGPTDEEISRHWQTIVNAPRSTLHASFDVLDCLLSSEGFDTDQIFTIADAESRSARVTTPLHLCAAANHSANKIELIRELVAKGADIHKRLPGRPNGQAQPESKLPGVGGFEGTTPLEWAIEFSSIRVIKTLLEDEVEEFGQFLISEPKETEMTRMDLMLLYAKAACRRQNPSMFSLLFKKGLDRTICDEDGNTIVHMICDYVETFWPNDDPKWTMEVIAERAAFSLITCLKWGVGYQLRNKKGVSGMDRVLETLKYSGNCEFHKTLAQHWCDRIDCIEDSSPRLIVKFAVLDDSEEEEEEEEAEDEESDGGMDERSEMSDDEVI